ncbi:M48 family metallopeptidase [Actinokineospora terrae]|uniref:Zn-dependent protease with chaperone function n=1 Tax=Actinokineospora terrae TaxID=155974 RepID=A0A1H9MSF5_9PSEU|nr:M48 family metallopeptidase [Actinokineospora terrae]SER26612.1 Zn-dependent protease with chaperone function [Actinokineospora terrae]
MFLFARAAVAVGMLAGFYLVAFGLLGGLVALEVAMLRSSVPRGLEAAVLVVPVVFAILAAVFTVDRRVDEQLAGIPVTPRQQPRLWELVRRLADEVGTRVPDEIRVVAEVNARVVETTRVLGLVVLRRRMYVGAPLLAAMTERQLAAVLAHELGHYANRDTRLSGVVLTGRDALVRLLDGMTTEIWPQRHLRRLFLGYTKLYARVSSALCRRQELAADAVSARITGSDAAVSALRELHVVDHLWRIFTHRHLAAGWSAGYLPRSMFDGFAQLRATPEAHPVLDHVRQQDPQDVDRGPYDSHPPMADRIAAIGAMAVPERAGWAERPAIELLDDAVPLLDRSLMLTMDADADRKRRVDWATLGHVGFRHRWVKQITRLVRAAGKLVRRPPSLGAVLDALDAGRLADLVPHDRKPGDPVVTPQARRERARVLLSRELYQLVLLALIDAGHGRWSVDWTFLPSLDTGEFDLTVLPALVEAALAEEPDTSGLRALLAESGVELPYRPLVHSGGKR